MITRRALLATGLALPLLPAAGFAEPARDWTDKLLRAARTQIGVTTGYDPAYVTLGYPGGDVPRKTGVCTDVIIRAYRDAFDVDLQQLVHADMKANFSSYPGTWGLTRADRNIDHRRVPNLERYFTRQGLKREAPGRREDWQAGDLVTMRLGGRLPHIAIFSGYDPLTDRALYIHNIGGGTREEEIRTDYDSPMRFRFPPPEA
ncbi:DUF1287 domain-containing protein [Hyphomonas sp. CACIAM 19H1]|uniref:DUF1287 domain-containing protein n=1 Tax=Hyphomonas sp. CACIAM 19H1 TaxID=1873716 RepID=UPI000DED5D70|nr:DUF1287 domain-containing protein [Hyphomonas sp. CACIAM 19H1]AXE66282.1 DUF1287 domain-containing protein [Hyphomonas sp. CACIAM 19H1]